YLRTLDDIGYTGPLTIEREIPEDREQQKADIGKAVSLLTELKKQLG
ncbi:MAG TPA: Fe-S cluster assembly protein HesB, partial [Planctomycetaceae bacterium]|nr:Fe-S cluster assembly protein HesB [Planctomycetaceae bacterium]